MEGVPKVAASQDATHNSHSALSIELPATGLCRVNPSSVGAKRLAMG